jgi:hypothetical protein
VSVTFTQAVVPAPVIGTPVLDPGNAPWFHAPISSPAGTHVVFRNPDPATGPCLTSVPSNAQPVVFDSDRLGEGVGEFYALEPDACVSFFAVDDTTGRVSDPTQVLVEAPLPTETPTVGPISILQGNHYPWMEMELGGAALGHKVGYWVIAGACPATPPSVARWRTYLQGDDPHGPYGHANYGLFPPTAAGANCVLITALDWFGWQGSTFVEPKWTDRHGPVVMREFVDDGPAPPTVGQPVWDAALGKFRVPTLPTSALHAIYDPAEPDTCPLPGASGSQELYLMVSGNDEMQLTPPATRHACVTFYLDAGEGPVPLSAGVPVELDVPQGG